MKLLLRNRKSGDDKAIAYYYKIREVYNIKLFYHNLRVEMFYQERVGTENAKKTSLQFPSSNFKENMDLVFEFSTVDNKKSNINNWKLCQVCRTDIVMKRKLGGGKNKMKHSFLTADTTGIEDRTLRSEKISPEDDDRATKKGILSGLISRKSSQATSKKTLVSLDKKSESSNSLRSNGVSEYESDANLISHRREINLSVVDEEYSERKNNQASAGSESDEYCDDYMPTTQRGLITEHEDKDSRSGSGFKNYELDCKEGSN